MGARERGREVTLVCESLPTFNIPHSTFNIPHDTVMAILRHMWSTRAHPVAKTPYILTPQLTLSSSWFTTTSRLKRKRGSGRSPTPCKLRCSAP